MLYIKWYLSELGSIMFIQDHVCTILGHLCINLWYFVPVLIHFESCHCQKYNLSQSPSNLSQSSSIYLSHVRNRKKLEANEIYLNHLQIYLSHPQLISVTFKFISVILNLSQSSPIYLSHLQIYLSHSQFISVILNLSQSSSLYLSHLQFISVMFITSHEVA